MLCLRTVVSHFDTSKVTLMGAWESGMFWGCSSLEELDLTSFDTSQVTSMREMFAGCTHLKVIKVSKKWVENEGAILYTFSGCGVNHVTCVDCEQ